MWVVLLFVLLSTADARAYIDPGSASYMFQALAGTVFGAVFLLRSYWGRVRAFVRSRLASLGRPHA